MLEADLGEHRIGDFLVAQAIEKASSGCHHMPTTRTRLSSQIAHLAREHAGGSKGSRLPPATTLFSVR
ncbi:MULTISPECIES: hypothetical protein [unclassified Mesorhizobium]|uniref:hypothetical protein n=1 Tax=unclassified Mesorhizobium TaxID=325217 RepID=UPI00333C12CD